MKKSEINAIETLIHSDDQENQKLGLIMIVSCMSNLDLNIFELIENARDLVERNLHNYIYDLLSSNDPDQIIVGIKTYYLYNQSLSEMERSNNRAALHQIYFSPDYNKIKKKLPINIQNDLDLQFQNIFNLNK